MPTSTPQVNYHGRSHVLREDRIRCATPLGPRSAQHAPPEHDERYDQPPGSDVGDSGGLIEWRPWSWRVTFEPVSFECFFLEIDSSNYFLRVFDDVTVISQCSTSIWFHLNNIRSLSGTICFWTCIGWQFWWLLKEIWSTSSTNR